MLATKVFCARWKALRVSCGVVFLLCVAMACALNTAAQAPKTAGANTSTRPKLVVMLVVDQMRADYVDKFQAHWTGGLKRLVEEGAWFR
ncbi:MAG: hypothetical protein WA621_13140, partial [Candidatus Acidiferrum sp.]